MISIIIPYFNKGKFLNETLDSVLSQDFVDYEIIIINDGSTDRLSLTVLDNLSDPKILIYHTANLGVCHARNYGVTMSKGKYLLFLDADDKIAPGYLSEAYRILESKPNIKVVSGIVHLFGDKSGEMDLPEFSIEKLIARNILIISCLIRKMDFEGSGGFNSNMNEGFEDWDFWLSLLENGGEVYRINQVVFYYRIQITSRNHTIPKEKMKKLRKHIYENHKPLYSSLYFDPLESFEYLNAVNSKEYKIGQLLANPLRKGLHFFKKIKYSVKSI